MNVKTLKPSFDFKRIEIEQADYANADQRVLANMAFEIFLIREFETALLNLSTEGCVNGPVHTSIGEEACAAGAMAALEANDKIASTHRAHHHYLAKAISYYSTDGFDAATQNVPESIAEQIRTLMGEVMGLKIGCCGGRGGSMHLRNAEIGVVGTNAIVGGGVPLATGAAFASKYRKDNDVVVCFLGDGAINQGAFHEAANLAGVWKLPIIYFIENNLYAVGTSIENSTATADLVVKAGAYGISGRIVDGMNPLAVSLAMREAVDYVRSGKGAIFVEAKCYRYPHHAGPVAGSNMGYRTKEEEEEWQARDAYTLFPQQLIDYGILAKGQLEQIKAKAVQAVKNAVDYCTISKDGKYSVKDELWPELGSIETGLRSDGSELSGIEFKEIEGFSEFETTTYVGAIAAVTGRHIEKDGRVFVLGEEVASFGGGPYGATKGLPAKYPDRILNTPISESGFTGLAGGAAMSGLRPVVEIMFPDFALVAADQLFNQIGKLRHMYGNTTDMPVVVRTRIAIGCGYGGQHSGDPSGIFSLFSGWTICAPSSAFDYIGLFNSAMQSKDPILMVEHHLLYPAQSDIPKGNLDYFVQIGKAKVLRPGSDVTVLCYASTVDLCTQAAEQLKADGIDAEVVDLRTISPKDIDYETIGNSLKRSNTMVIVEQAPESQSIGPRIAAQCQNRFFDYLDAPITTVSGLDIPYPVSRKLEAATVPSIESVKNTICKVARNTLAADDV